MGNNGHRDARDDVIQIEGRVFNMVKKGPDKLQVASFVKELVSERDELISQRDMHTQREEHLSSLAKLAERTITEADKVAEEITREATEQAKDEADAMIAKAREEAEQVMEETKAEIVTTANEQAAAIKANAEKEAELLLANQRRRVQSEIGNMVHHLYVQLMSQFENLKEQIIPLEEQFQQSLSQLVEQGSTVPTQQDFPPIEQATIVQQGNDVTPDIALEVSLESIDEICAESQEPAQAIEQAEPSGSQEKEVVSANNQDTPTYEIRAELKILPPVDVPKIGAIMAYLDRLPDVKNTDLIPHDVPLIIVTQRKPISLVDILEQLPEVAQAKDVTNEEVSINGTAGAEGELKKIEVTLS